MKLIIDIPDNVYEWVKNTGKFGIYRFDTAKAIKNGISLDDAIAKLEEHKYSREYCIEHGIDWAIDMGMVRIILNNIGEENEDNK